MKSIFTTVLVVAGWLVGIGSSSAAPDDPIDVEITVTRTAATVWQIDYVFSRPVVGIDFGPPIAQYRMKEWRILTPGLVLIEDEGAERLNARSEETTSELH